MLALHRIGRAFVGVVGSAVLSVTMTHAQDPQPVLVLIDRDSVAHTQPPNGFTTQDVNEELAAVGMRDALPYFRRNTGQTVTLRTGVGDNAGWHTLWNVPASWSSAPDEADGASNYFLAGPGLGSPEESGERARLLRDAGVAGLSAEGVQALQGRTICGIVYQGDLVPAAAAADLSGPTVGVVAFRIDAVTTGVDALPNVEVSILDPVDACQGDLVLPPSAPPSI
jgi:hypothetical protein